MLGWYCIVCFGEDGGWVGSLSGGIEALGGRGRGAGGRRRRLDASVSSHSGFGGGHG